MLGQAHRSQRAIPPPPPIDLAHGDTDPNQTQGIWVPGMPRSQGPTASQLHHQGLQLYTRRAPQIEK